MAGEDLYIGLIFSIVILLGCFLIYNFIIVKKPISRFHDLPKNYDNISIPVENYTPHRLLQSEFGIERQDYTIYNYLLKSIKLKFRTSPAVRGTDSSGRDSPNKSDNNEPLGKVIEDVSVFPNGVILPPRSSKTFNKSFFEKHFADKTKVFIYTFDQQKPGLGDQLFAEYNINTPEKVIKGFNVGMITSRSVAGSSDAEGSRPDNAPDGMNYIKIKNMTPNFLVLNQSINIGPFGTLRFTGRDHYGVRLGTLLRDSNGVFPDYVINQKMDFIYYGVTSDIPQPLFGGFQLFEDLDEEPGLTKYPMQQGYGPISGGPFEGGINNLFLPLLGEEVKPLDRWGL